ncbi:hypothetical protein KKC94_00115 [Patescibacteria group bacterium]|nr:hypothetical protein [Patescibacteria group bacterium]
MQQNSTDLIAKSAWDATLKYWKEFIVLPFIVTVILCLIQFLVVMQMGENSKTTLAVSILITLTLTVFGIAFATAVLKWCADIFSGKKEIDVAEGIKYGLSRFWGVVGTSLLTTIKIFLWALLLILPGLYKAVQYSQSVKISQLEKLSGNKANLISQKLIMSVGFLRTLGNIMAIQTVVMVAIYVFIALIYLVGFLLIFIVPPTPVIIVLGIIVIGASLFAGTFLYVFTNFQYLYYRDEQKTLMAKTKEALM